MTRSPVLFLVFNRPEQTARVFEAIRAARPPRLYVAADGPRPDREGEAALCEEVRHIATQLAWPGEVKTLFREKNLGCKHAVSSAITWFFEHEEQGVILEDDCLPHPDFFLFCDDLLERYANDERVAVVTGDNFQRRRHHGDAAYYFSRYNHCWGWASWRRAWNYYQGDLPFWKGWNGSPEWLKMLPDPVERRYWARIFDRVSRGEIDSWAYPWTACVWYHGGLTATPNVNLVTNIGFGPDATHTKSTKNPYGTAVAPLGSLTYSAEVARDVAADQFTFDSRFGGRNLRWPRRGLSLVKGTLRRVFWRFR
jgi:hypothetical protein